jgi:hypothetical protein
MAGTPPPKKVMLNEPAVAVPLNDMSVPKASVPTANDKSSALDAKEVLICTEFVVTDRTVACEAIPSPTNMSPGLIPKTEPVPLEKIIVLDPERTSPRKDIGLPANPRDP